MDKQAQSHVSEACSHVSATDHLCQEMESWGCHAGWDLQAATWCEWESGIRQVPIDKTLDRDLQTDLGDLIKEAELCLQELQLIFGHSLPDLQAQHVCMAHFAATEGSGLLASRSSRFRLYRQQQPGGRICGWHRSSLM